MSNTSKNKLETEERRLKLVSHRHNPHVSKISRDKQTGTRREDAPRQSSGNDNEKSE